MKGYKNSEGYSDTTAGIAIENVSREMNNPNKKNKIDIKCDRLRGMSNSELYKYIENRCRKAKSEGYNKGKLTAVKKTVTDYDGSVKKLLSIKGIDYKTAEKIMEVLYAE